MEEHVTSTARPLELRGAEEATGTAPCSARTFLGKAAHAGAGRHEVPLKSPEHSLLAVYKQLVVLL